MLTYSDFLINQAVCELRYPRGHMYWDKVGEIICMIEKELPDWKWQKLDEGKTFLKNEKLGLEAFFSWERIWIKQLRVENMHQLKVNCDLLYKIISSKLGIEELSRIGARIWHVLPTESVQKADNTISKGKIFNADLEKQKIFGEKILARDYVLIVEDEDGFKIRVSVAGVDRKPEPILDKDEKFLKFNPYTGVLVDADFYRLASISTKDFVPSVFIQKASKKLENNLVKLFQ